MPARYAISPVRDRCWRCRLGLRYEGARTDCYAWRQRGSDQFAVSDDLEEDDVPIHETPAGTAIPPILD